ncbi:MAG: hypothetical protein S4CHLAM7_00590 [Chlamydiae bacterium]|nr:hypothetical protein [Chlamydiota bacterium]
MIIRKIVPKFTLLCFLLTLVASCSISNVDEFELQGRVYLTQLSKDLSEIHDLDTLKTKKKILSKRFSQISSLMIAYHSFLEKHPEIRPIPEDDLVLVAAGVKLELQRILEIEGAAELIIKAEKEAYTKLMLADESSKVKEKNTLNRFTKGIK